MRTPPASTMRARLWAQPGILRSPRSQGKPLYFLGTRAFTSGLPAFNTTGINPPKTLVRGGLGLVVNTKSATEITARYDVEARKDFTNQTASIKFKMPF